MMLQYADIGSGVCELLIAVRADALRRCSLDRRRLHSSATCASSEGHGGAVTLIQRFGSAANLNIHLHCLVLDGVYRCGADGAAVFVEAGAPSDDELHALLHTVIARLMKMLTRRGVLIEEMGQTYLADPNSDGDEARTLRPLQAAAITYRIANG